MNPTLRRALPIAGLLATALLVLGFFLDRRQAIYSYLFAFVYVFTVVVGALFLLMIGHACNAKWFVPLRRQCERIVGALPLLAPLLVPCLVFARDLYPWTDPSLLDPMQRALVEKKLVWLNVPFFVVRALAYMAVFVLFGELLRRWSARQDAASATDAAGLRERMVKLSVLGLVVLSFTLTFAGWDWIMTLEPAWYSNLYGVYLFAGGILSALGALGVMIVRAGRTGELPAEVSSQHYYAIGRLQLAFVIFWAYIAFCHVLQQWIANLPVELLWYLKRLRNGWQWEGLVLIGVQFLLPFFWLLLRPLKKNPTTFATMSAWLVVVHTVDAHYLVLPALHPDGLTLHWMDFAALASLTSLTFLFASLRGRGRAPMPLRDPLLRRGLAYESPS